MQYKLWIYTVFILFRESIIKVYFIDTTVIKSITKVYFQYTLSILYNLKLW